MTKATKTKREPPKVVTRLRIKQQTLGQPSPIEARMKMEKTMRKIKIL